jgi:hypothetical protein
VDDRDRTAAALSRLDPESRALVELSYRRGLGDDDIGDLLQLTPAEIARRRETALGRAGLTAAALDEYWNPGSPAAPTAGAGRGVPVVALAALAVIAAVVVAVVLASGGGNDDHDVSQAPAVDPAGKTDRGERTPDGPPRAMRRLNGTYGQGTAQLISSGNRTTLRLSVSHFLRPQGGGYAVWLYNSPEDARRLYATRATRIERDIPLPGNYTRYRFAEVARAIPDLDSDHSGLSLLRAPIAALTNR